MIWRSRQFDPTTAAAADVLAAFKDGQEARLPAVDCYRAGVEVWRRAHPDHRPAYAARQAVAVILSVKGRLRIPEGG